MINYVTGNSVVNEQTITGECTRIVIQSFIWS